MDNDHQLTLTVEHTEHEHHAMKLTYIPPKIVILKIDQIEGMNSYTDSFEKTLS